MTYDLTNLTVLKKLLTQAGIIPRRSAGQHFLVCSEVVEATLLALRDMPPRITELGSGVGTLTVALVASGFFVRAIEKDEQLIPVLKKVVSSLPAERLELVAQDLRTVAWEWDTSYGLVGNIPYNLSGFIIRKLVGLDPVPQRVVLLVQQEVGERMVARAPYMNLLGLTVQLWGEAELLVRVPRSCFWPQPRVDSRLVLLTPANRYTTEEREAILGVARVFFHTKRKQIGGVLARLLGISRTDALQQLTRLGIGALQRPQELEIEQWRLLTRFLSKAGYVNG
jgi:16S rRNA (adenine1518-N6/adenine1519-N6)-dimethyltransferase